MKEERYHIALDRYDKNIVLNALTTLRNQQVREERPTDPVDELIETVAHAPTRKVNSSCERRRGTAVTGCWNTFFPRLQNGPQ